MNQADLAEYISSWDQIPYNGKKQWPNDRQAWAQGVGAPWCGDDASRFWKKKAIARDMLPPMTF